MIRTRRITAVFWGILTVLTVTPFLTAAEGPPRTSVREVKDNYFGTSVSDPYRWLENIKDPEAAAWFKAQNDYTRAVLDRIPARKQLLARIEELDNSATTVTSLVVENDHYFYLKLAPGFNNRRLYVRQGVQGAERLLLDPEKLGTGNKHFSIDYFRPSQDARYVAYGISPGGSEDSVLHVIETATGKELGENIDRVQFGVVTWRNDGRSFVYHRLTKPEAGAPPTARYLNSRTYLHLLGRNPDQDPAVFGRGLFGLNEISESDIPFVIITPSTSYALGLISHGVQNEITLYVAPLTSLETASIPWRKVVDVGDEVTDFDIRGDDLYLLTHKGASRFKVIRTSASKPDLANPSVVVPAGQPVLTGVGVAKDAIYVRQLDGGIGRLLRIPFSGGKGQLVPLPFEGAIQALALSPRLPGAYILLTSWTKSPLWYAYDPKTGNATDTRLNPPSSVDFSQIESKEVKARGADGTMVPLSIVYKRGLPMDGSNPTLLMGYGAYGITMDPAFTPTRLAWLERGGVYAVAHVRGGGEYGEDWHKAGQKLSKQNTISDFIACAEYLIQQKYTSPSRLAGIGGSAGGITVGGALTQRPELFAAIISAVGVSDNLRIELSPNGPPNIPEFGSVKTEEGFKALYGMSSYHHVKDNAAYPAVLLTTGINDPRVDSWQAGKMTARLQAATTSGKPVLMRVDYDAGHGMGSTKSQRDAELADEYAFLFWQFGIPEFQPKNTGP